MDTSGQFARATNVIGGIAVAAVVAMICLFVAFILSNDLKNADVAAALGNVLGGMIGAASAAIIVFWQTTRENSREHKALVDIKSAALNVYHPYLLSLEEGFGTVLNNFGNRPPAFTKETFIAFSALPAWPQLDQTIWLLLGQKDMKTIALVDRLRVSIDVLRETAASATRAPSGRVLYGGNAEEMELLNKRRSLVAMFTVARDANALARQFGNELGYEAYIWQWDRQSKDCMKALGIPTVGQEVAPRDGST